MAQSPTQPKAHPFFDKHTVICTILLIIWAYFLVMIPAAIGTGIVCAVLRLGELQNYLFIGVAAMALVTLLVHRIWFQPEFKGILFRGFAKTLKCSAAILVFWLLLFLSVCLLQGKSRRSRLILLMPAISLYLTLFLASPVAEFRYGYPMLAALPFYFAAVLPPSPWPRS